VRSVAFLLREFGHSLKQNRFLHFTYGAQVTVSLLVLGGIIAVALWLSGRAVEHREYVLEQ